MSRAIGARLTLRTADRKLVRWITSGSSYLSSHDKRTVFGLGGLSSGHTVEVEIRWPNDSTQTVTSLEVNRYHRIVEL